MLILLSKQTIPGRLLPETAFFKALIMEMLKQRFALTASAALALAILSCLTCAVFAQSPPPAPNYNAGDAMKQAAPPATPSSETDHGKAAPPPVIIIEPEKQLTLLASEKLFILSITVAGATADEAEKLAPIVAPYTNRELTITEINEAAGKVTRFYHYCVRNLIRLSKILSLESGNADNLSA